MEEGDRMLDRISERITSGGGGRTMSVRDMLKLNAELSVSGDFGGDWSVPFSGPAELTPDGMARWSSLGVLGMRVIVSGSDALVTGISSPDQEKAVCSLFNTLEGRVNEDTYAKYVKRRE